MTSKNNDYTYEKAATEETGLTTSTKKSWWQNLSVLSKILFSVAVVTALIFFIVVIRWVFLSHTLKTVQIFQTSVSGDRLTELDTAALKTRGFDVTTMSFSKSIPQYEIARISVYPGTAYQEILGFGGAFTEAAAYNFYKLPPDVQKKVVELYWGDDGISYSLGRVHINSCDFSLKSYSFDDIEGDYSLSYFDSEVTHDNAQMLPLMRLAIETSKLPIKIVASPWSPPAWMKVPVEGNRTMTGSAVPNGLTDDPQTKSAWASYISKFITAYEYKGVKIWAVTPQNEPEFPAPWEACAYNTSYESDFINSYLGPVLDANNPEVLILAFDHNKDHLRDWTEAVLGHDEGPNGGYVDGMAFHWYTGAGDRLMDGTYGYDNVNFTHHFAPNKLLLATEGCNCPGVILDDWLRTERYGHDIIFDLNNFAQGWLDWNLLVDSEGGPNHLGNMCDAPLVTNVDFTDIHIQPQYYYIGHFSKFVLPGYKRVLSQVVGKYAFENLDPNTRAGVEVMMFPCEESSRQVWMLNSNNTIELTTPALDPTSTDSYMARLCVADGFGTRPDFLRLVICVHGETPALSVSFQPNGQLLDTLTNKCVGLAGDVREAGALLSLLPCSYDQDGSPSQHQQFTLDISTGEVKSLVESMCMTAGWPFLTGTAFVSPEKKKTVVIVMNEAALDTQLSLTDTDKGSFTFGINSRSIQTLTY